MKKPLCEICGKHAEVDPLGCKHYPVNLGGEGKSMNKWIKFVAIAAILAVVLIVFVGMYAVWRDCDAVGGITVRGLFWLECIKR